MKSKLNIFYVSSEVFPFTKATELGEVSSALPKYLKQMGHDIRVMMPNYKTINERKYILRDVIRLQGLEIKIGDKVFQANGKSAFIPDSKVQIYFLDNKELFDTDGLNLYNNASGRHKDNLDRYIFFSIGCLETLKLLHWQPDIIHCNNWQTALIPLLLKSVYGDDPFFKNSRTLLSIHDFAQQGNFDTSTMKKAGIPEPFLNGKDFNFLEAGIKYADMLNTVSESYACEAQENSASSFGLEKVLKERKNEFFGIANRIDQQVWNPETDSLIPFTYSRQDLSGKYKNKKELLERFALDGDEKTPVISTISPLVYEKGIDLIIEIIDDLMKIDLRLIVSGIGDEKYQKNLRVLQKKYPKKIGLDFSLDNSLVHLIEAGSDLFLMPSQLEPGGLNQLYSLTYGTIPIVRNTGGLGETVKKFETKGKTKTGTGFVFNEFKAKELLSEIKNALKHFNNEETWGKLIQNAMKIDFSWKSSAPQYVKLYQKLLSTKSKKK